ncbi:MAG: electron transfer flavoprotein subunit beta/FixA family protein [Candidatus Azobacteroides pseudotrichonymphae]|nr:MAG: electron transfer flavoprotein subunit beta/FixA family protein [Candidatus Azobacteroides pseudotrichonymphae]
MFIIDKYLLLQPSPILIGSIGILELFIYYIMSLRIIVLAKQVPDTRNVGKDAMKDDGTINRSALAAIFNPEDLNALEQALRLKEQYSDSTITLLTMGPPRAAEIIREGLFRGIDNGYLLTDRVFAGADTLATSYTLHMAIKKIGNFDIIISGRQAIDGDTAQVGPQVAEKLGIPQITYAEEIQSVKNGKIFIKRRLEHGIEIVEGELPMLVTVNNSAPECRPRNARLIQKYKYAKTPSEKETENRIYVDLYKSRPYLNLIEWSASDIGVDNKQCGLSGSPTKVKKIENVVFQIKESKILDSSDIQIEELIVELMTNHTIG